MKKSEKLPFDLKAIAKRLHIKRVKSCSHLKIWLQTTYPLEAWEEKNLEHLLHNLEGKVEYWNEEELKMQMVGILFFLANIEEGDKIMVFYERQLDALIEGEELSVICDCMVASPGEFNYPEHPYFFLQEFKREKKTGEDPEAQMLQAMIIAQHFNQNDLPVYGGYLVGSRWRFTTLVGKDYCVSRHFDADEKDDLFQIVFILRHLKELILARLS